MIRKLVFVTILGVSLGYNVFLHTRVETWKGLFFELEATATESVAGWQACQETFDSCATEAETAQKILVMYAGRILEEASPLQLFENPRHPYTRGLQRSVPQIGQKYRGDGRKLQEIPGLVPDLRHLPGGCRFHPRCPLVKPLCSQEEPELIEIEPKHSVRCFLLE